LVSQQSKSENILDSFQRVLLWIFPAKMILVIINYLLLISYEILKRVLIIISLEVNNDYEKRLLSTLVFAIFLTDSTIIFYQVGRWAAIGVALEVFAFYLLIKLEIESSADNETSDSEEDNDKD
jgi:hypothetical protein